MEVKQNLVRIIWSPLEIIFPRVNFGGSGMSSGEVSVKLSLAVVISLPVQTEIG